MFPAKIVDNPAPRKICSISAVVVVLPFDPVMPTSDPFKNRYASSISLQIFAPAFRARSNCGKSAGTPGLGTIKSCSTKVRSTCPLSSSVTPASRNFAADSTTWLSVRDSVAVTRAPRSAQNSAVATPVRASPTTNTRLFFSSIATNPLPQLQRRHRKQRKNQRQNPESHNHLRLAPPHQLKMMMQRRHAKNPLPSQLERAYLQNHRHRLDNENPAHKKQQNLLLDNHCDRSQRPAKRQRADIAHKNFRRMRVVPKESERRPDQRAAKHRQLRHARSERDIEICRPSIIAADIRQHRQSARRDHRATDRQPIQPVRQIHRVRRTCNHNRYKNQKRHKRQKPEMFRRQKRMHDKIGMQPLRKRNAELRRIRGTRRKSKQSDPHDEADQKLQRKFLLARQPEIPLLRNLRVIVDESDPRKRQQRKNHQQHEPVRQVRPQQRRHQRRKHNQHAAHRRRAFLFLVRLRPFFADVLPDLHFPQLSDQPRPEHKR